MIMAIDENVVTTLLEKLYIKLSETVDTERRLGQLINALITIRKAPDDSLPIDTLTGNTMTEDRRSEILEATIRNSIQFVGGE